MCPQVVCVVRNITRLIAIVIHRGLILPFHLDHVPHPAFQHHQWHHVRRKPLCLTLVGGRDKDVFEMLQRLRDDAENPPPQGRKGVPKRETPFLLPCIVKIPCYCCCSFVATRGCNMGENTKNRNNSATKKPPRYLN